MSVTHLTTRTRPQRLRHGAALDALADATGWVFATLREWGRRLRERDQLARLDHLMLRDIGLTEAEREVIVNKPFWRA
jgi:uncharacterized protein YjiS (DUF1127 family)